MTAHKFEIISHDRDYALIQSQTRKEVAHALNRDEKTGKWECSCEDFQLNKNTNCKHKTFIENQTKEK